MIVGICGYCGGAVVKLEPVLLNGAHCPCGRCSIPPEFFRFGR